MSSVPVEGIPQHAELEALPPQEILRWAAQTFGPGLVMTSAFGLNGVALIHMLHDLGLHVPVIFVDTGYHFDETVRTKERIEAAFGIQVLTYRSPESTSVPICQIGPHLSKDWHALCCEMRKIKPMQQALADLRPAAILNARARFQADSRHDLPVVEWYQRPVRVNPLALWAPHQIKDYVWVHGVPQNPLHDQGYPSVGCWPCTQPVADGEDIRAGRWSNLDKTECGLWTRSLAAHRP